MTMFDSKYKLTNSELELVNECLDVFEASGLTGLLNHMHWTDHGKWVFPRDEVLHAIAQSTLYDVYDETGVKFLPQETLVNLFRVCLGIVVDQ
ncbi:hypothetical protein QII80_gp1 [ssRNA phage Gephyllon.4_3]|uniref:Uncharacterized protein n=2 Tax=Norzivirales TaxID=2842247 RepID=A0A8S5L226_9VIRU|nr:hypothetical protein QII80_gp1 [ssRNA phage Gephyllon.4_3]QDH88223.1 MAG: hypothetical protein H4BulkLitter22329_000005 [Leviviridae sp.]DAD51894.1 TPA_asm: hypothetical protein [ssRNA phage Gephyllon.4_3]